MTDVFISYVGVLIFGLDLFAQEKVVRKKTYKFFIHLGQGGNAIHS